MKITILGIGAAYAGDGEACSGFMVEEGFIKLLVDCGTGVVSKLQKIMRLEEVTDILITHLHADHFIDLIPYRYALYYGLENPAGLRPRLHLPPGGSNALQQVVAPFSESDNFFQEVFDISEYQPSKILKLGDLTLKAVPVKHYIPTFGVEIENGKKLAYSSDTGPCVGLEELARDAELFICNVGASLENTRLDTWGHTSPEQAAKLAKEAGVRRLVITHLWPESDPADCLQRASKIFHGNTELAETFKTYSI